MTFLLIFPDVSGVVFNLIEAKEIIESNQSTSLEIARKRKAEIEAVEQAKIEKKKKKKWYEMDSDEESKPKQPE